MDEFHVKSSVLQWIATNLTGVPNPSYDDEPADRESLAEWVEFLVDVKDESPRRKGNLVRFVVSIEAHCCAKTSLNRYRAAELADAVSWLLHHAEIPVVNYDSSSGAGVGQVRFGEADVRDLSDEMNSVAKTQAQHVLVSVSGVAQAVI